MMYIQNVFKNYLEQDIFLDELADKLYHDFRKTYPNCHDPQKFYEESMKIFEYFDSELEEAWEANEEEE